MVPTSLIYQWNLSQLREVDSLGMSLKVALGADSLPGGGKVCIIKD